MRHGVRSAHAVSVLGVRRHHDSRFVGNWYVSVESSMLGCGRKVMIGISRAAECGHDAL